MHESGKTAEKTQDDHCPTCGGFGEVTSGKNQVVECPSCHGSCKRGGTITKHIPQPPMDMKK